MSKLMSRILGMLVLGCGLATSAHAAVITFTGGTTSAGSTIYEEAGFRVQSFGGPATFGDYYGVGNNVVHAHWQGGGFGSVTKILVTKIDGTAFDLNYFILTSNTDVGGGPANGTERAYIHASADGTTDSYSQLLPSENWGFPAQSIFMGSQFDNVKAFWFDQTSGIACFGMDSFYINEAAPEADPSAVPEPSSIALAGLALLGLGIARRRKGK